MFALAAPVLIVFIGMGIDYKTVLSDIATADTVAGNLTNYLDQGASNSGMGSGGTHFENLWRDVNPYMNAAGTGFSSSSTLPFIICR